MSDVTTRKTRLFLSYSRKDLVFAEALHQALEDVGYDVLLDRTDIAAGEDWQARLGRLIIEADTVVFCLSPNSVSSKVCGWEVEEAARLGKRILPVVAKRVADADVPPALAKLNFIFMDGKTKAQGLAALKDAIESDLPWLREHTRLGDLAQQWNARPGNAGVLRGPALEEAERWIASQPRNAALATDLHRNFIAASRKAATTRQRYWFGGAAAIVTLSLGLAGWSEINRREAERQTAIAEEQRANAQQSLESATRAANGMVFDLAMSFANTEGVPVRVIRKTLDQSQSMLEELLRYNEASPDVRFLLATTYGGIADSLVKQGESDAALAAAEKAETVLSALSDEDATNPKWMRHLSFAQTAISKILRVQGKSEVALVKQEQAIARAKALILSPVAAEEDFSNYAEALVDGAALLAGLERGEAALALLQEALKTRLALANRHPANMDWQSEVAASHVGLSQLLNGLGKHDEALSQADQALERLAPLLASKPDEPSSLQLFATAHELAAGALQGQGDHQGALARYNTALKPRLSLANRNPDNADLQHDAAMSWINLARASQLSGDMLGAFDGFGNGVEGLQKLVAREPENFERKVSLAVALMEFGDLFSSMGQMAEALSRFTESLRLAEAAVARDGRNAQWRKVVALVRWRMADAGEAAEDNYRKALDLLLTLKKEGALRQAEWPLIGQLEKLIAGLPG